MCGILAWIRSSTARTHTKSEAIARAMNTLVARGPEGTRVVDISGGQSQALLGFTRLAINGLNTAGMQPFTKAGLTWICNGEIYNAPTIEKVLGYKSESASDCEVIGALWNSLSGLEKTVLEGIPTAFARSLDGVFAIVLYDAFRNVYIVARDPYGVRPLYYSQYAFDGIAFASERKTLELCTDPDAKIHEFPPGEVWTVSPDGKILTQEVYHSVPWLKTNSTHADVHSALITAVKKRLLTERPIAAMLSGGLDSSLIAAIVQKMLQEAGGEAAAPLKTFSIGMAGSSDLKYARIVANWIGSEHHEITVTADEMFAAIPDVIRDIESYDITSVRASVGNWLVAREIKRRSECKVVFNGDGSDEVWGSYLYFYRAPNDYAFEAESQRLMANIHRYDVLRSDRCISSHGLEARTPFLDKQFVAVAMGVSTAERRPCYGGPAREMRAEKQFLREAFTAKDGKQLLPYEVLWRRKEAFSDGVSSTEKSWYEEIQDRVCVPDNWKELAKEFKGGPVPHTKEAFYYRSLYESMYKKTGDYWPYWMPKWSPETTDPSARTLSL